MPILAQSRDAYSARVGAESCCYPVPWPINWDLSAFGLMILTLAASECNMMCTLGHGLKLMTCLDMLIFSRKCKETSAFLFIEKAEFKLQSSWEVQGVRNAGN